MRAEIEITPAMIEAGIKAWSDWEESDDYSVANLVRTVFQQMKMAVDSEASRQAAEGDCILYTRKR